MASSRVLLICLTATLLCPHPGAKAEQESALVGGSISHGRLKVENNLAFSWTVNSTDPTKNQIDIFAISGTRLVSLQVLSLVQDARKVSIHDVSAIYNQLIVVSAVYVSREKRPAATLLYFDWQGGLLRAIALDPTREAWRLAMDEGLNVWTLTTHSGDTDPAKVPLIVEYDAAGHIKRELLPRSTFPVHSQTLDESSIDGPVGFGRIGDSIWIWLPKSTDFVLVNCSTYAIERNTTALPGKNDLGQKLVLLGMAMPNAHSLVAEFRAEESATAAHLEWESWSIEDKNWKNLNCSGCSISRLAGAATGQLFFSGSAGTSRRLYERSVTGNSIE